MCLNLTHIELQLNLPMSSDLIINCNLFNWTLWGYNDRYISSIYLCCNQLLSHFTSLLLIVLCGLQVRCLTIILTVCLFTAKMPSSSQCKQDDYGKRRTQGWAIIGQFRCYLWQVWGRWQVINLIVWLDMANNVWATHHWTQLCDFSIIVGQSIQNFYFLI